MKNRLTTYTFLALNILLCSLVLAQESLGSIEFRENDGFLKVEVPLHSFFVRSNDTIEIIGKGKLNESAQQVRFEISSNKAVRREGVTHTEKSCNVSFDEGLIRQLAQQLSVPLSSLNLTSHNFDVAVVEGDIANVERTPVKLLLIELENEDLYSEWYLAVDIPNKKILLSEKNNNYRQPFVHAFQQR